MIRDIFRGLLVTFAIMVTCMLHLLAQEPDSSKVTVQSGMPEAHSALGDTDDEYAVMPLSTTEKVYKNTFQYDDMDGTTVKQLVLMEDPASSYCASPRAIRDAKLLLRLKMGENDYEFAKNDDFLLTVKVTARAKSLMGAVIHTYLCTLEVSVSTPAMGPVQMKPEQLKVIDFTDNYDLTATFDITAQVIGTTYLPTTDLEDNIRLDAEYTEEFDINPKKLSDTTEPIVRIISHGDVISENPVRFTWTVGGAEEGCADRFPDYQLQILRLYNVNPEKTSETDIEAQVDWSQALTYDVGDTVTEVELTLAEGRGYYAWRVRPVGNLYPGGIANDLNWGVWSASLGDNSYAVISATNKPELSSDVQPSVFFYEGFDEHLNWIYARNFSEGSEGTRVGEKMTYATSLLQPKQNQARIQSRTDRFLVGQTVYDFSGRPTLVSLPAPVTQGGFGYREAFLQYESEPEVQETYTALNFDYDADAAAGGARTSNYKEPNSLNYGSVHEYYSDLNSDLQVPNADGYAFSRTVLYPDGTGRMKEQSGAGEVHRLKPATSTVDDRTIKTICGGAPDAELIAMFGDEAPAASSVQKVMTVDPNKVISVKYVSKEGKALATCLVKTIPSGPSASLLDDLNSEEQAFEELVRDTIWNEPRQRRFALPVETTITMRYSITPNQIEAACGTYCKTCEYKVYFYVHDLEDRSNTKIDSLIIGPHDCDDDGDWPQQKVMEWTLPAGSYIAERRIVSDNPVDDEHPLGAHYEEYHADQVRDAIKDELDAVLAPVRAYLDSNNIEGLYAYLDTAPEARLDGDAYFIETPCCTLQVPIKECGEAACPSPLQNFEQMLFDAWPEWGDELNDFFRTNGNGTYPSQTPFTSGTGAFNAMIGHMIDDGYNCGRLLQAWEVLVETFGQIATTDGSGAPGQRNPGVDLLQTFLRSVGKIYEGFSDCPYGTCGSGKPGYLEYAYKYFYYEGQSPECEEQTNLWGTSHLWGADPLEGPYEDKEWEQFYNCWTGHKSQISTEGWMPQCSPPGDTVCLKKYAQAVEDSCRSMCWKRFPGFVESVKEAYRLEGKVIEGDEYLADGETLAGGVYDISMHTVYCHAWSLVVHCESGCDLTIFRSGTGSERRIDSIGSPAERDSLTKSMTYTYRVAIPDEEDECPDSLYHVTGYTSASEYARMVVSVLNRELGRIRKSPGAEFESGSAVCAYLRSLFVQLTGVADCWPCSILALTKDEGSRKLLEAEVTCAQWPPNIYAIKQNIVKSEFVVRDSCLLRYLWTCQEGPGYTDSIGVCGNICANLCSLTTCFTWVKPEINPQAEIDAITCEEQAARTLRDIIDEQAARCVDAQGDDIRRQYREQCIQPDDFGDTLSIEYNTGLYHFTLYYYDRAGNLVRTVPPNGVDLSARDRNTHPNHTFRTLYYYNSLGQLASQITPDAGRTNFWYNGKGQLRIAQNAEQAQPARPRFSYSKYDRLGRTVESGEGLVPVRDGETPTGFSFALAADSPNFPMVGRRERTFTVYSAPAEDYNGYLGDAARQQRYLRNRVSYTYNDDGVATYYSYDPHGNVEWMEQWTPGLGGNYIGYTYDLISGNMLEVHYDSTIHDQFHHRYSYDADNRLVKVETSRDGSIWDRDASYVYYDHGPLRSIAIGEDSLQQLDYTYTIQGWLKGINHPSLDSTRDPGRNGLGNSRYAPDAFGMILGYYEGDFQRRYNSQQSPFNSCATGSVYTRQVNDLEGGDLYNGNISSWTSNIIPALSPPQPLKYEQLVGYTFRYDRLNRLLRSDFRAWNAGSGQWPTAGAEYRTTTTYDPAGNIRTMNRRGYVEMGHPAQMDDLAYQYQSGTNRLEHVDDAIPGSNYDEDIDDQSSGNYEYDAIGNMIKDEQEGVRIRWNAQGKIDQMWKQLPQVVPPVNQRTFYSYNAAGNRVRKEFIDYTHVGNSQVTYYVRDANEQVIAIYEQVLQVSGEGADCITASYQVVTNPDQILDSDGDWVSDPCDGCEETGNRWQEDYDGDGVGDICDNCPLIYNPPVSGSQPSCAEEGGGLGSPVLWWQPEGGEPEARHGWKSPVEYGRSGWVHGWPVVAEFLVYGTGSQGRFGTMHPNELRDTNIRVADQYTREVDKKEYELHDHLGNVRVVMSDVKLNDGTSASPVFRADVQSYTNYYPFGMAEPGRRCVDSSYRYGFNGKEMDNEWNDQSGGTGQIGGRYCYDFGYRILDPRLGRWMSIDPLASKYSGYSPYHAMACSPNIVADEDGAIWRIIVGAANKNGAITRFRAVISASFSGKIEAQVDNNTGVLTLHRVGSAAPIDINNDGDRVFIESLPNSEQVLFHALNTVIADHRVTETTLVTDLGPVVNGYYNTGQIDVTDLEQFQVNVPNNLGMTRGMALAHEVVEQYHKQAVNAGKLPNYLRDHAAGVAIEEAICDCERENEELLSFKNIGTMPLGAFRVRILHRRSSAPSWLKWLGIWPSEEATTTIDGSLKNTSAPANTVSVTQGNAVGHPYQQGQP